jgi:hypothetical protein
MMRKIWTFGAALVLGFVLSAPEAKACDWNYVSSMIGATWKVNNAFNQGFGSRFHGKPQVHIQPVGHNAVSVGGDGPFYIQPNSYRTEPNLHAPGSWCGFVLDGNPARIAVAANNFVILEIGPPRDRNKIELIRRP